MKAESIDREVLERYLETRKVIAGHAERVVTLSHLLGLLRHCAADSVEVSPSALAAVADLIDSDICSIQETLDDFIYPVEAEEVVEEGS